MIALAKDDCKWNNELKKKAEYHCSDLFFSADLLRPMNMRPSDLVLI